MNTIFFVSIHFVEIKLKEVRYKNVPAQKSNRSVSASSADSYNSS